MYTDAEGETAPPPDRIGLAAGDSGLLLNLSEHDRLVLVPGAAGPGPQRHPGNVAGHGVQLLTGQSAVG